MNKKITCPSCGAQFEDTLAKCPYCGTMYYPAAEKEYMNQMEDLRGDVGELKTLPREETKKHFKNRVRFIWTVLIIFTAAAAVIGGLYLHNQRKEAQKAEEEYLWVREHIPELDSLYENGQYDAMADLYASWYYDSKPVWSWKHSEFAYRLSIVRETEAMLIEVDSGHDGKYDLTALLYNEIRMLEFDQQHPFLSEEEYRYVLEKAEPYLEDMKSRFRLDDGEVEEIRKTAKENYGVYPFRNCEEMVQEFLKENPS